MTDNSNIDLVNLEVSEGQISKNDLHVKVANEGVLIIVTQAFGPKGDSLVGVNGAEFDGYPAVSVRVKVEGAEGLVNLSPFHGDRRKTGFTDITPGTRCELFCPVSGERLDYIGRLSEEEDAPGFYAIYLTPNLSQGEMVLITDIWDDYNSRIIDHNELVSRWTRPLKVA
ncbi:MAG: hypothetical protein AAFX99_35785 [Myxococcota bacterium]